MYTSSFRLIREPDLVLVVSRKWDVVELQISFSRDLQQFALILTWLLLDAGASGAMDFIKSQPSLGDDPSPLRKIVIPAPLVVKCELLGRDIQLVQDEGPLEGLRDTCAIVLLVLCLEIDLDSSARILGCCFCSRGKQGTEGSETDENHCE